MFDRADSNFTGVVAWLESLERVPDERAASSRTRFHPVEASEDLLRTLVECLISLAVRSPMNREAAVSLAERLRGPLHGRERNSIIGLNMRDRQRAVTEAIGTRGKFVILFSPDREFIFGDGFFHNIASPWMPPLLPRVLVPLTPEISVLHAVSVQYGVEPRVMTMVLDKAETGLLNDTVQVYARNEMFFRLQQPPMTEEYRQAAHLCCAGQDHLIERFIGDIPGVLSTGTRPGGLLMGRRR